MATDRSRGLRRTWSPAPFIILAAIAIGAIGTCAAAVEDYPERRIFDFDQLIFRTGDTQFGTVISKEPDGSIKWQEQGKAGRRTVYAKEIDKVIMRQSAVDVVRKRGRMEIDRKDATGLRDTLKWGLANKAGEDALTLAVEYLKIDPGNSDIGEIVLDELQKQKNDAEVERVAKAMLTANPLFEPPYEAMAKLLEAAGRSDELKTVVEKSAEKRPASAKANDWLGKVSKATGDLKAQLAGYWRNWSINKDATAGARFAGLCIRLGDYPKALRTGRDVLAANPALIECQAYVGTALLAQGDLAGATEALTAAVAGTLPPEVMAYARYNLGLAHFRAGRLDQARAQWKGLEGTAGAFAQAIIDHQPFSGDDKLPAAMKPVAREYAAGLALENLRHAEAKTLLEGQSGTRQRFLNQIAAMLAKPDDSSRLRALQEVDSVESLRWQVYGMLLAQRFRDAEALMARLPADDGYVAVYRVYAAAAQEQKERARELFAKVAGSKNPPREYASRLAEEYAQANDEIFRDDFNWPAGPALATGWKASTPGTNIRIQAEQGLLIFSGEQAASSDPVNRAWRVAKRDRLRLVQATFDLSGVGQAIVGLELLDGKDQKNGIAYGVLTDGKLGWRPLDKGVWGKWQPVPIQVQGKQVVLRLEYESGRVNALPGDVPGQRIPLGDFVPETESMTVGIFGYAEPGATWRLGADIFEIQLKPLPGKSGAGGPVGPLTPRR